MIFDVVIGNPPYHIKNDVDQNVGIYKSFMKIAEHHSSEYSMMIVPRSWTFQNNSFYQKINSTLTYIRMNVDDYFNLLPSSGICYYITNKKNISEFIKVRFIDGSIDITERGKHFPTFTTKSTLGIIDKIMSKKESSHFDFTSKCPSGKGIGLVNAMYCNYEQRWKILSENTNSIYRTYSEHNNEQHAFWYIQSSVAKFIIFSYKGRRGIEVWSVDKIPHIEENVITEQQLYDYFNLIPAEIKSLEQYVENYPWFEGDLKTLDPEGESDEREV